MKTQLKIATDALNNILSYHANDNQRPKAFYIAADALSAMFEAHLGEPTEQAYEASHLTPATWPFHRTPGNPVTDPKRTGLKELRRRLDGVLPDDISGEVK